MTDEYLATLQKGEAVLSRQGVQAAGGPQGVEDMNRGMMMNAGGQVTVIQKWNHRLMNISTHESLRNRRGELSRAIRETDPISGRHVPAFGA